MHTNWEKWRSISFLKNILLILNFKNQDFCCVYSYNLVIQVINDLYVKCNMKINI
jgi:hypothetical protein